MNARETKLTANYESCGGERDIISMDYGWHREREQIIKEIVKKLDELELLKQKLNQI